jgi:hypothetical protein
MKLFGAQIDHFGILRAQSSLTGECIAPRNFSRGNPCSMEEMPEQSIGVRNWQEGVIRIVLINVVGGDQCMLDK